MILLPIFINSWLVKKWKPSHNIKVCKTAEEGFEYIEECERTQNTIEIIFLDLELLFQIN